MVKTAADYRRWDLQKKYVKIFFNCGVDVITTGNHVWAQKETVSHIEKENRLLKT